MANFEQWAGFKGRKWTHSVDVRDFIQENYTPYEGDEAFLEGPTEATDKLWGRLQELQKEERAKGGVLDMETEVTVESRWQSRLVQHTDTSQARNCMRSSQNIIKHITRVYSMFIHQR